MQKPNSLRSEEEKAVLGTVSQPSALAKGLEAVPKGLAAQSLGPNQPSLPLMVASPRISGDLEEDSGERTHV